VFKVYLLYDMVQIFTQSEYLWQFTKKGKAKGLPAEDIVATFYNSVRDEHAVMLYICDEVW
jgi:hypothetical protein